MHKILYIINYMVSGIQVPSIEVVFCLYNIAYWIQNLRQTFGKVVDENWQIGSGPVRVWVNIICGNYILSQWVSM